MSLIGEYANELVKAKETADQMQTSRNYATRALLPLIRGRLRRCGASGFELAALKRELRDFNLTTRKWK